MPDTEEPAGDLASIRSLAELFQRDSKRFEWMAKQYYDLFSYHAAQRLTAFNFFLVSLSFFSTAYATLISKSDGTTSSYFPVAGTLALAAYLLVVAFGRLDKRNEQIIGINEKPLIRIQRAIRLGLSPDGEPGDEVWETFVQADRSYRFRTFGELLPVIYSLAAAACAAGAMYGFSGPGEYFDLRYCAAGVVLAAAAAALIRWPFSQASEGKNALSEAVKVVRPVRAPVSKTDIPIEIPSSPPIVVAPDTSTQSAVGWRRWLPKRQ
jgi:hypothetical protein